MTNASMPGNKMKMTQELGILFIYLFIYLLFLLAVLEFELRVLQLLGRLSTTESCLPPSP
jgi:hypothetical protein